ncbi:unnamed protein product [Microthlaspi erraticum]|uniref:DNA-directed RNA polymerase III subunit RPC4 n=1 Tax=Microthlaspi erraticum TaxID=1685480 RepID=A0A6D2L716_9BRAS|nr:unnamed protein product [Microthlaspi erraticum]
MDSGSEVPRKSKRRFQPRASAPSRRQIAPTSNNEAKAQEEEDKRAARQLAKRIGIGQRRPKTETKASSSEVAFQPDFSSLTIRSFGVPKEDDKHGSDVNPSSSATASSSAIVPAASARKDGEEVHNLVPRTKRDYVEPWDYKNSYYPTVLPLRKPYSGDPERLDKEEFGDIAKHLDYDENSINSAEELGLTSKQHYKNQMFFFKIPDCLPVLKKGANTKRPVSETSSKKGKAVVKEEESTGAKTKRSVLENSLKRSNPFEDLPGGFMGKMLVYKSGAVKMKFGDLLYDVSPGPNAQFLNDVAAIDTEGRHCGHVGSSANFVTVTPDVESLLKSASGMEIHK